MLNRIYKKDKCVRKNFYTEEDIKNIFPIGLELERDWKEIKQECVTLYESLENKDINYLNNYHIDIGNEKKIDWTTIPLRLFGINSNKYKCPYLYDKINKNGTKIISCIISIMNANKIIEPHYGPYEGLLRYQLPLVIPKNNEKNCYLHVNGENKAWIEGKCLLFDESLEHGAVNMTDEYRMVLLIDVARPYISNIYNMINHIVINIMGITSYLMDPLL